MNPILTVLAAIAAVAGGLGVAYAVFTSSRVQTTIRLYQQENEAQGKRIKSLEDEGRIHAEQIGSLKRENETLRDLATGRSLLEGLVASIAENEQLRQTEHRAMMELLREMKESLSELWRAVAEMLGRR